MAVKDIMDALRDEVIENARLSELVKDIAIGKRAYLFVGASTLGDPGTKFFEERTGRKVSPLLCSQTL